jgi:hypothetical protein
VSNFVDRGVLRGQRGGSAAVGNLGFLDRGKKPIRRQNVDESHIKMDTGEIVLVGTDWMCFAQDRNKWRTLVIAVINLMVP